MWDEVGVMRTEAGIDRGLAAIRSVGWDLADIGVSADSRALNLTWHDWLNLRSLVEVSQAIAAAARARENSRGAHYREDFPDQGDLESSYFTTVH